MGEDPNPTANVSRVKEIYGRAHTRSNIYEKKVIVAKSATRGRKLFDETSHSAKADKAMPLSAMGSTSETSMPEEDNSLLEDVNHVSPIPRGEKDNSLPDAGKREFVGMERIIKRIVPIMLVATPKFKKVYTGMNKENNSLMSNEVGSPPISSQLGDLFNSLKLLYSSTTLSVQKPEEECTLLNDQISSDISLTDQISTDIVEPKTPITEQNMSVNDRWDVMNAKSPREAFNIRGSGMKDSLVQEYLRLLNTSNKEELKSLKGIGDKRETYILELREESPEPFKSLDNLKDIGLSTKQIKGLMKKEVGGLFS